MKLCFVRHGQTDSNKNRILHGITDVSLNEEGVRQAEAVMKVVPGDIKGIYSSPLLRCRQTAEIINKKFNFPIIYDDRLKERNFGSLEGRSWTEFDPDYEVKDKERQEYDYRPYGGESMEDVRARILDFIDFIKKKEKNSRVLVVAHGGIVRLVHKILKGQVEKVHNASLHEFDFPDE